METIWSAPFNEQMIWGSSPIRLSTNLVGFTSSSVDIIGLFVCWYIEHGGWGKAGFWLAIYLWRHRQCPVVLSQKYNRTLIWYGRSLNGDITNCLLGFGIKLNDPCEPILIDPSKDQGGGGSPGFHKVFSTFHSFHAYGVFCIFVQRKKNVASGTFPPQPDSHTRPYWRQFPSVKDEGPSRPNSFQAIQKPPALQILWPF